MDPFILRFGQIRYDISGRTLIMGALNVTPDSFSDGDRFLKADQAVEHGVKLAAAGADILDIGGESTRPGAKPLPEEEELRRVLPVIRALRPRISIPISIDTRKARVAEAALQAGAEAVNDISALRFDSAMAAVVARRQVPLVLMHMRGDPETMQTDVHYHDLLGEIEDFLRDRIAFAQSRGIRRENLILDPGIGFGKSLAAGHNLILLKHLSRFKGLGRPLLIGTSRKSFLGRILDLPVEEREEATMATVAIAILNGANIVRVHEVERMRRVVRVADAVLHCTEN